MTAIAYHAPDTIEDAVRLLADDPDAVCLAGGQTLVAAMNTGIARPSAVISLRRIAALEGIFRDGDGAIAIGAMATHRSISREGRLTGGHAVLREAAGGIGHPAIRSRGTIGGSICHADPMADYPGALAALGAEIEIASRDGRRRIGAGEFFVDFLTTALEPGELVARIHLPPAPTGSIGVYEKFARAEGDFATLSVALMVAMEGARCRAIGLALGSCGSTPVRSRQAESVLRGSVLSRDILAEACRLLDRAARPMDDVRGSAAYRRALIPRLVSRAVERAKAEIDRRRREGGGAKA